MEREKTDMIRTICDQDCGYLMLSLSDNLSSKWLVGFWSSLSTQPLENSIRCRLQSCIISRCKILYHSCIVPITSCSILKHSNHWGFETVRGHWAQLSFICGESPGLANHFVTAARWHTHTSYQSSSNTSYIPRNRSAKNRTLPTNHRAHQGLFCREIKEDIALRVTDLNNGSQNPVLGRLRWVCSELKPHALQLIRW